MKRRARALAAAGATGAGLLLCPAGLGASAALPNPCTAVPDTSIAALLGMKTPPPSTLSTVLNMQRCNYEGVKLTVQVGYTVMVNPAAPAKVTNVPGLPHGIYKTYRGSTWSEVSFYVGSAAKGTYGVVSNFGKIRRAKLEKIAKLLHAGIVGSGGSATTPGITIVPGS
jgi:hypothetical protein